MTRQVILWIYAFYPRKCEEVYTDYLENVCIKLAGYYLVYG